MMSMQAQVVLLLTFCCCAAFGLDLSSRGNTRRRLGDDSTNKTKVSIAVVLPHSMFKQREYKKMIMQSAMGLSGMDFVSDYELSPYLEMVHPIPAPTEVLGKICDQFLANRTAAILYLTDSENYGRDSVASQYFMQLAEYVRLPVISWTADNSAFEHGSLQLQLAPTIKHQASAILMLLERYGWHSFSIITGMIAGHRNFQQVLRELISNLPEGIHPKQIIDSLVIHDPKIDLPPVARTEARVFILYSTRKEAITIMAEAKNLGLTGKSYVWVATQAVIGANMDAPEEFPIGMLGVHFACDRDSMIAQIPLSVSVFGHALEALMASNELSDDEKRSVVQSNVSCQSKDEIRWKSGSTLFKFLRNVKIVQKDGGPPIEFNSDGSKRSVELKIVNLQPVGEADPTLKRWEEIGVWQTGFKSDVNTTDTFSGSHGDYQGWIDIKDIVWPGNALKPPDGIPEKRFIRVTFLEEDPYVMLGPPSACSGNKGVLCMLTDEVKGLNLTDEKRRDNSTVFRCCSGFCVDLLIKFATDLSFDFNMVRVRDGKWGGVVNGKWNGLVAELMNHETDIVMTSLKINSGRERVIDFSVPYLETGITILVAKRTGIISPTAFLEPFDTASWMLVALVAIQVAAGCIFFFEWLSPSGYNLKTTHLQGRFSFIRTLWLVWAVLFQAAVNVDCPRGSTARFMAHIWATFALIFLAIYTANLAAFMITREEFPNLSGLEDKSLSNPTSIKPPFRFGTIPNGATDYVVKNNFPVMHDYMKKFNKTTVKEGFKAVKHNELDAFIYDATVLEYLVGQDDECNVLTVGSWYAMTGYGVGFPKGSMWIPKFNEYLMKYRENGDLERMHRFWFTGACDPRKRRRTSSKPLALAQFTSAFILLGIGISLSVLMLFMERFYFHVLRKYLARMSHVGWCKLLSLSIAESLTLPVDLSKSKITKSDSTTDVHAVVESEVPHHCSDPLCTLNIEQAKKELREANERISLLKQKVVEWQTVNRPLPPTPPEDGNNDDDDDDDGLWELQGLEDHLQPPDERDKLLSEVQYNKEAKESDKTLPILDLSDIVDCATNGQFGLKHRCKERQTIEEIETVL